MMNMINMEVSAWRKKSQNPIIYSFLLDKKLEQNDSLKV